MAAFTYGSDMRSKIQLANCSLLIAGVVAAQGNKAELGSVLTIKPNVNFEFTSSKVYIYAYVSGAYTEFEFIKDSATGAANHTITKNIPNSATLTLATKESAGTSIFYQLTSPHVDALSLAGVDMYVNGVLMALGDYAYGGDTLKLSAHVDRTFTSSPPNFSGWSEGKYLQMLFEVDATFKTATLTLNKKIVSNTDIELSIPTIQVEEVVTGTNNVYLIDSEILKEINESRFVVTPGDREVDYGVYILSLIELPFDLEKSDLLAPENIFLAEKDTNILANKVKTDVIVLDLGSISVPELHNNLLDFQGVETILYLPRLSAMGLDSNMVIGQTIGIKYLIDCYNGTATVNISSSKIGGSVIETKSVDLGVNVPYALTTLISTVLDNNTLEVGGDNGIKTPFIEVVTNEQVLSGGFFTSVIEVEGGLSGITGYVEIDNAELSGTIPKNESDLLLSELLKGVIIK